MTLTGVEISYASGGGAHQATVTFSKNDAACGNSKVINVEPKIGDKIKTGNKEIDDLLDLFLVEKTSEEKGERRDDKIFRMIDSTSEKMKRIVVLVRGINAPVIGNSYSGRIYATSQHTNSAYKQVFDGDHGIFTGKKDKNFVILGTVYSSFVDTTEYPEYQNKEPDKSEVVYCKQKLIEELSYGPRIKIGEEIANIRYGYTAAEFFQALESIKIKVNNKLNFTNSLFDSTGSLENCISSICSFYGYYWYIHPKTGEIHIISSSEASSIEIPSDGDGSELSFSKSNDQIPPNYILSLMGTSDKSSKDSSSNFDFEGRPYKTRVYRLAEQEKEGAFYLFFQLPDEYITEENFESIFWAVHYKGNDADFNNFSNTNLNLNPIKNKRDIYLSILFNDSGVDTLNKKINKTFDKNSKCLLKRREKEYISSLFNYLKTVYTKSYLYVSRGYPEWYKDKYSFLSTDGASVSEAIKSGTPASEIAELKDLVSNGIIEGSKTIDTIAAEAGAKIPIATEYFYIATILPKPAKFDFSNIKEFFPNSFNNLEKEGIEDEYAVYLTESTTNLAVDLARKSRDEYDKFIQDKKIAFILRERVKEGSSSDAEDDTPPKFEIVEQSLIKFGSPSKCSETRVLEYSGNIKEVEAINSNNTKDLGIENKPMKSFSATYAGIKIPEFEPTLSSVSFSFGERPTTTIEYSTVSLIPVDRSLIMGGKAVYGQYKVNFGAGAKNYFKLR